LSAEHWAWLAERPSAPRVVRQALVLATQPVAMGWATSEAVAVPRAMMAAGAAKAGRAKAREEMIIEDFIVLVVVLNVWL
jgi:hypothetical protein